MALEAKHGRRRAWINDDLQLAAQAICLQEMTRKPITQGAIFHASSKPRREVQITGELFRQVEQTVTPIRGMLGSRRLPAPVNDSRCKECSLNEGCQPRAMAARAQLHSLRAGLLALDGEPDAPR